MDKPDEPVSSWLGARRLATESGTLAHPILRLLSPANSDSNALMGVAHVGLGYHANPNLHTGRTRERTPRRNLDAYGPAGSVASSGLESPQHCGGWIAV